MLENNTLIEQLPGYILWKDLNSVFLKSNMNMACLLGFKHPDELVGITDYDMHCKAVEDADLFISEDQKARCSRSTISTLSLSTYANDEMKVLLANKALFFDENAQARGTVGQCIELNSRMLRNIPLLWDTVLVDQGQKRSGTYYLNSEYGDIKLSKRQAQCLFYLLRGKTTKMIAKILQLSNRTVESYLEDIKDKMGCANKAQLIEKSIYLGFLEIIPPGIIPVMEFDMGFKFVT